MPFFNDLLQKPFRYGAQGSDFLGCYGLAKTVLRRYGIPLIEVNTEDFELNHDVIMQFQHDVLRAHVYPYSMNKDKMKMPTIRKRDGNILQFKDLASVIVMHHVFNSEDWVTIDRPEESVLGIFNAKVLRSNIPHLSVFITNCEFIHSCPPKGVQLEFLPRSPWREHLVSLHRFIGKRLDDQ
ncbi:hypothetical protein PITCH_A230002 [uncultured Desulfobacterium sp.]|uniref:NlpC/P60 domain-containing protein n=1 Tax=uncultured Desulfobacterium sp. TaxID=201089 RepID=A0A445MXV0_9BACT|nr:hypothetical protein PITCH_A230002 [uncultured Desulfobacterium sp.]